jgi:tetratricopeptide (TPR) repeat protein
MLLLASHRTADGEVPTVLHDFWSLLSGANHEIVHLFLKELPEPEARSLARALLGPRFAHAEDTSAWIARASGGSPFFVAELCQHPHYALAFPGDRGSLAASGPLALDPFIHARVAGLSEEGRRVLEALSLAGQPVDGEVLARACGLGQAPAELFTQLRTACFIRIRGQGRNLVETCHDRIRECLARNIPIPMAREIHRGLARSLEMSPRPDPQALAYHFQHAEELDKASTYAEQAAEQAAKALAFEAAARLFRQALDLCPGHAGDRAGDRARLLVKLGDALANAGLDAEAACIYHDASGLFSGHEAIRLRRLAAEHFFRCGRFDQGMATLEAVLATLGMKMPTRPWRALVSLLIRRSLIRIRGLGSRLRKESEIPPEELDRIDICWAGAMGLGPIDHIRGGAFQARGLGLALKAGEPFRVVRALAHETIYVAHRGIRSQAATQRVLAATQVLAEQLGEPGPLGRALIAAGTAGIMQGRWKAAMELHEKAEAILRDHCSGMDYELHISQHHGLAAHWILGNVREVSARLPVAIQTAWDKADLLALTNLRTSIAPYLCLARDEPDLAKWEVRQAMEHWSSAGFHLQHYNALAAQANIHLYEGEPLTAWDLLTTQWPGLRGSLLLRVQPIFITMLELRARTALAVVLLVLDPGSKAGMPWLKTARADIRALAGEKTPYGDALALKLQALEALVAARTKEAALLLSQAETAFGACDMGLHAMAVRQIGSSLEGGPGSARTAEAIADMRNQGVVHPERFARMHVPCG